MPAGDGLRGGRDADAQQPLAELEDAAQDVGQGEIRAQLLVGVIEATLPQTLGVEREVPQLQGLALPRFAGEAAQVFEVRQGVRAGCAEQLVVHAVHRLDRGRHLRRQAQLGVALEAQQARLLATQAKQAIDQGGVVQRAR